jgi:hypothetical protein
MTTLDRLRALLQRDFDLKPEALAPGGRVWPVRDAAHTGCREDSSAATSGRGGSMNGRSFAQRCEALHNSCRRNARKVGATFSRMGCIRCFGCLYSSRSPSAR